MRLVVGAEWDEASDLVRYLDRLVHYDPGAVVRVISGRNTVGVFGGPPFEVISWRGFRTVESADVDTTVSASALRAGVRDDGVVDMPQSVTGPAWVGVLPPRSSGWRRVGTIDVATLIDAAASGIARFRERKAELGAPAGRGSGRAESEALAAEIWDEPISSEEYGSLPLRAAHAARALGFLGADLQRECVVREHIKWVRLDAPFGAVACRRG